jgi:hypothetical protein
MALVRTTLWFRDVSRDPGDFTFDPSEVVLVITGLEHEGKKILSKIVFRNGLGMTVWDENQDLPDRWAAAYGEMINDED